MGAQDDEIYIRLNQTKQQLFALNRELHKAVIHNWEKNGEITHIYFYYAGHGIINVTTQMLLNSDDQKSVLFNFESVIHNLG